MPPASAPSTRVLTPEEEAALAAEQAAAEQAAASQPLPSGQIAAGHGAYQPAPPPATQQAQDLGMAQPASDPAVAYAEQQYQPAAPAPATTTDTAPLPVTYAPPSAYTPAPPPKSYGLISTENSAPGQTLTAIRSHAENLPAPARGTPGTGASLPAPAPAFGDPNLIAAEQAALGAGGSAGFSNVRPPARDLPPPVSRAVHQDEFAGVRDAFPGLSPDIPVFPWRTGMLAGNRQWLPDDANQSGGGTPGTGANLPAPGPSFADQSVLAAQHAVLGVGGSLGWDNARQPNGLPIYEVAPPPGATPDPSRMRPSTAPVRSASDVRLPGRTGDGPPLVEPALAQAELDAQRRADRERIAEVVTTPAPGDERPLTFLDAPLGNLLPTAATGLTRPFGWGDRVGESVRAVQDALGGMTLDAPFKPTSPAGEAGRDAGRRADALVDDAAEGLADTFGTLVALSTNLAPGRAGQVIPTTGRTSGQGRHDGEVPAPPPITYDPLSSADYLVRDPAGAGLDKDEPPAVVTGGLTAPGLDFDALGARVQEEIARLGEDRDRIGDFIAGLGAGGTSTPVVASPSTDTGSTPPPRAQIVPADGALPDGVSVVAENGFEWVKDASGAYLGVVNPQTGERVLFPAGATNEEKQALVDQVLGAAPSPAPTPAAPEATVSTPAPGPSPGAATTPSTPATVTTTSDSGDAVYTSDTQAARGSRRRRSSGSSDDSDVAFGDDGDVDFDLKLEDFIRDFDGDGKIGRRDREMGKRAFAQAKAARRKKGRTRSTSTSTIPAFPTSPIREHILSELNTNFAEARAKQQRKREG